MLLIRSAFFFFAFSNYFIDHVVKHSFVFVAQCHVVSRTVMVLSEEQEKVKASYFTLYAAS